MVGAVETLIGLGRLQAIPSGWRLESTPETLDSILSSSLVGGYQWQIDNLSAVDRSVLEAAAAVGARFSPAAVAEGLDSESVDVIDGRLAALAERRVLIDTVASSSVLRQGDGGPSFAKATEGKLLLRQGYGGPAAIRRCRRGPSTGSAIPSRRACCSPERRTRCRGSPIGSTPGSRSRGAPEGKLLLHQRLRRTSRDSPRVAGRSRHVAAAHPGFLHYFSNFRR